MAVIKKFGDDQAGSLAALVAYYAFFSLFPLLLVFVTILGFVLQGDSERAAVGRELGPWPVPDHRQPDQGPRARRQHWRTGDRAGYVAARGSRSDPSGTERIRSRVGCAVQAPAELRAVRLRGLGLLGSLGLLFIVATVASGIVTGGLGGPLVKVAGIALSLLLNFGLFFAAFRLMTSASIPTRCLLDRGGRRRRLLGDPAGGRRLLHRPRASSTRPAPTARSDW